MTFIAQLSHATEEDVLVPFTLSGTAVEVLDYTITPSPLTIAAGELRKTITIDLVDDHLDEADETVIATMEAPTNALVELETFHVATIVDNDSSPTVSFFIGGSSGAESVSTINLEVVLNAPSGLTVSVDHAIVVPTSATGGVDFAVASGTLSFAPGETSKTIALTIVDDLTPEPNESLSVGLSSPSNATLGSTSVYTFVILDNDSA